jgi:hypothetical protein
MGVTCHAGGLPRIVLHKIPSGYPGTVKSVHHMGRLIAEGAKDFPGELQALLGIVNMKHPPAAAPRPWAPGPIQVRICSQRPRSTSAPAYRDPRR